MEIFSPAAFIFWMVLVVTFLYSVSVGGILLKLNFYPESHYHLNQLL
jgi:hypothetical protein